MDNIISGINVSGQVYTILDPNAIHESEFSAYSGAVDTSLSSKASQTTVDTLNDVVTAHTADTSIHLTSGDIETIISSQTADFVTGEELSSYTYDKATIDSKIASGGTFDPTLYYKKSETSGKTEIQNALDLKLDASAFTESDYYKKSETSGKTELDAEFDKYYEKDETSGKTELDAAFSAITKTIDDNEQAVSEALNDLDDKKVESGDVVDIVSAYTYSKDEIDDKIASGGGITSGDVQTMIDQSVSGTVTNIDITLDSGNNGPSLHMYKGVADIGLGIIYQAGQGLYWNQSDRTLSVTGKADSADVYTKTETDAKLADKQDKLTAGTGIDITNNVISATGGSGVVTSIGFNYYSGISRFDLDYAKGNNFYKDEAFAIGDGLSVDENGGTPIISTTTKFWTGTKVEFDAITEKDNNTIYLVTN